MFSFTRFCLRVLADPNEIIRRLKRNDIMTITINRIYLFNFISSDLFKAFESA